MQHLLWQAFLREHDFALPAHGWKQRDPHAARNRVEWHGLILADRRLTASEAETGTQTARRQWLPRLAWPF